jgi:Fe-S-cluster-containing dehydrogenase component/DMSO reductase anchor subunit
MQKAFVFDVNKCTGCEACQVACSIENQVDRRTYWRGIHTFNSRHVPGAPTFHHSLACNHCVDPPCMKHCPALAYSKDPATGAVTIDADKCIGCKYCSWACPYDAPRLDDAAGTMEKCTFCSHRLEDGLEPACVALCPTGALGFEDHDKRGGGKTPGFTATEIGPAVRFVPLRETRTAAADTTQIASHRWIADAVPSRITLRSEWSLMVFSFLAVVLVGVQSSTLVGDSGSVFPPLPPIPPIVFLMVGAVAMALSAVHLGRRTRAWRAVLNVKRSWFSREVLLFPAFLAVATVASSTGGGGVADWFAAAVGFGALFCMDSVYHVTRMPGLWLHSAQVFLTGLLFVGLFSASGVMFGLVVALKTFLYLWRKYNLYRERLEARPWLTRARVLIGLAAPLVIWWRGTADWYPAVVAGVLIGELIDRCEFYLELDAPSPSRQMAADLAALSRGDIELTDYERKE